MRHQDMLDNFIAFVGVNRTSGTQSYYFHRLRPMLRAWDAIDPSKWTRPLFERYLSAGKAKGWSPRQIQMVLTAARQLIKYQADIDDPIPNFVKGIEAPDVILTKPDYYKADAIDALLRTAREGGQHRWELFISMAADASCRRSEVFRAQWEDANLETRELIVRGEKVGFHRVVPINDRLFEIFSRLKETTGPIFQRGTATTNLYGSLHGLCKRAGVLHVKGSSFHAFRHSFGTLINESGEVSLDTLATLMGHRDVAMTRRYVRASPEALRKAVGFACKAKTG